MTEKPVEQRLEGIRKRYLTPGKAAGYANVTENTIRSWVKRYGIGEKVGGRWRIDPEKLEALLLGELAD